MVVNAPNSIVLANAEHTMAMLLALARNIPQADRDLRGGGWNRARWEGVELNGKTLGVVGLGRVGVLVAQRARAFGMRIVARELFMSTERAHQLGVELDANPRGPRPRGGLPRARGAQDAGERRHDLG